MPERAEGRAGRAAQGEARAAHRRPHLEASRPKADLRGSAAAPLFYIHLLFLRMNHHFLTLSLGVGRWRSRA